MFIGEYVHSTDAKGRLIVPAKFRDELGSAFIATKGLDKCISIYTLEEWKSLEEKIKSLPTTDPQVTKFVRFFFSGACECEPDNQGRIMLPPNLRKHAEISKEIVSVGVARRIEIWSLENWEKYNDDNFIDSDLAVKMAELGI